MSKKEGAKAVQHNSSLARVIDKSTLFSDLGYHPHPGQREVHESKAARRVVAAGVRWGKSICAAMEGIAALLEPRERSIGWIAAPTYELASRVFDELTRIITRLLEHRIVALKEHEHVLVLRNLGGGLSTVRGKSADNPVSLLGEGLDWLVIDEAARLRPVIWESHLSQRLIDRHGWMLAISTPHGKGWFHELFKRGQRGLDSEYESWNLPSWSNPFLDAALIERERSRVPEAVFRQEFGAEFVEGSGAVFRNVRECATGDWEDPRPGRQYVAGLDLARVADYTVLVIADEMARRVVFVDRFHRVDWAIQLTRLAAALDRYRRPRVFVDSTGVGEPIFESLRRVNMNAVAYPFTQKSKAALIDNLTLLMERKEIVLPRPELWPEGIDELESFEFSVTEHGSVRTGAPYGTHDDCVVSLGLAAFQLRPRRALSETLAPPQLILGD